jgi:mannose-6-phosphate isomerase-like protein (cupin superfamily)
VVIDGTVATLKPGDAVAIQPDEVHQIFNDGPADLVFLAVCAPAWTPDNSEFVD